MYDDVAVAIRVFPSFGHPARLVVQPSRVTSAQDKKFPAPVLFMSFYTVSQHTVSQPGSGVSAVFPAEGSRDCRPGPACAGLCAGAGPGRGAIGHDLDVPGPLAQLPAALDAPPAVATESGHPPHSKNSSPRVFRFLPWNSRSANVGWSICSHSSTGIGASSPTMPHHHGVVQSVPGSTGM